MHGAGRDPVMNGPIRSMEFTWMIRMGSGLADHPAPALPSVARRGNCTRDDSMILKFTPQGKFIMAIGHRDAVEESDSAWSFA